MTRMIRNATLAVVLVCALFAFPALASTPTDVTVTDGDLVVQDGMSTEGDRGQDFTVEYGDPDDISGNRSNGLLGDGLDIGNLLTGGLDVDADLWIAWLMYQNLLMP